MSKKAMNLRVSYAGTVYGKEEIRAVNRVLSDPLHIAAGPNVHEFEAKVAKLFAKPFGVMVNSGSSANLISIDVLDLPRGSEVITPALTFSTTLAPLLQFGLTPVFVDVEMGTYLANIDEIEKKITKKTKALMIPSLIGNVPDLERLERIAKKHKLVLIEDSCDTLGATFAGKPTGHYTDISTTSFYASHIITAAGGGGMACFKDPMLARRALLKANWGRESTLYGAYEKSEEIKKRFDNFVNGERYDGKFIFSEIGYNFQTTELQGAFGLVQLKRLPHNGKVRAKNFAQLYKFFTQYEHFFVLPKMHPKVKTNWLAFPLTVAKGAPFTRNDLALYLEKHDIQTRPIFTGNVLRQPAFKAIAKQQKGSYPVSDYIMQNGILIGCHHGLTPAHIQRIQEVFSNFLKEFGE
ncbi:MAG TPA: aminotransferase class I/II-fold pyridoxal phosphate-dependent enzyme [Candidatus Paceibacterota bacterium]